MSLLSDLGGWAKQTFTPQQVQRPQQQQQPSFMQRVGQMINQGASNVQNNWGYLTGTKGTQQQQNDFRVGMQLPDVGQPAVLQPIRQFVSNYTIPFASGIQDAREGKKQAQSGGLSNYLQGSAQQLRGVGKMFTPLNVPFQLANALSVGTPMTDRNLVGRGTAGVMQGVSGMNMVGGNVKDQTTKIPFVGDVDLVKAGGSMYGFTQNPINKQFFKLTNTFFPTEKLPIKQFISVAAQRGFLENIILKLPDLPKNATDAEKIGFLVKEGLWGSVSEVMTGLGMKTGSKGFSKLDDQIKLKKAGIELVNSLQRWNQEGTMVNITKNSFGGVVTNRVRMTKLQAFMNQFKDKARKGSLDLEAEIGTSQKKPNIFQERLNAIKQGQGTVDASVQDPFVNNLVNQFRVKGSKTFSADKIPQTEYFVKKLGKERINEIYKEVGGATNEKGWIESFWNKVKTESPNWQKEWKMANESLIQPSTPQGGVGKLDDSQIFPNSIENQINRQTKPIKIASEPKMKVKKTLSQDIEDFGTIHPPKDTVVGPQAEVAYKNLKSHADSLTDRITNGIKHYKITEEQFTKYIQNPETAPIEIKPIIDAHKRLMEIAHTTRENPNLGQLQNYFPHIGEESMNLPSGIKNIGKDLWISDFNAEVGSAKKRTGAMTDYSTDYNKVMKNYFEQVAYDKYGKRVGYTPKVAEFVKKVETHLTPDAEGNYKPPSNEFDYVGESAIKQEVKQKTPIFSKMEPLDTFDSLKRKFSNEKSGGSLARTMEQVRDMRDKIGGMELKLEKMGVREQIDYLASELTYNKGKLKDILLKGTNNGTTPLPQSRIIALLRAEKNYRLQNFIDEVGKYEFGKNTQDYLNTEIDRLMKNGKYEQGLLDKVVNFVTSTFYKAQIWGNLNTGLAQKGESLRIPPLYGKQGIADIATGMKNDMMTGGNILKRYDFSGVETDISKQLDISKKPGLLSQVDKQVSKVGNIFVNIGENSKNKDFLYAAEGQGKRMGLEGKELYTFVRNELFANGFILHEFNTPQMLKNPLVRLFFQYQQYNIKLFNRALEMAGQGEKGKALGMVGSQVVAAVILSVITGKGIETVKDKLLGAPVGPGISLPIQMATLMKEIYDAKKKEEETGKSSSYITEKNTKKLTDLSLRNTIPFANQFYKSKGATDVLKQGYDTQPDGNVTYMAPNDTLSKTQGVLFGKSSFKTNRDYYNNGGKALGDNQTKLFKQEGASQQSYDKVMTERKQTQIDNNLREQVRQSGSSVNTKDFFYYQDPKSGDVRKVDKNFTPQKPELTGNTELDKKLISKYKGELTARANDILELYTNDQMTKDEAEKALASVKSAASEYTAAKKPKKVSFKKISIKIPSISNIRVKKLGSLKLAKQPKIKAIKFKKIKTLLTSKGKGPTIKIKA